MSSTTSRLRLDFHHIKVNFKKSEIVQALIYIRGGMVNRCHGSIRTSVWGSRFATISVQQKKKEIYYARVLFIYFEQAVVQITISFHLDAKILITFTLRFSHLADAKWLLLIN